MLKKVISVILILAVSAVLFCSCGDDDSVTMIMPIDSDPLSLDPQVVETESGKLIAANCYEGLVRLDENYKIVPGVAESWEISSDGLVYTFHLRKDSNWRLLKSYEDVLPEGYEDNFRTQVTAYDFQFGLRRALDPATGCTDAEKFFCIKNALKINEGKADVNTLGVSAKDDTTLVITLSRANPDFLRLLTLPCAMPCNEEFFRITRAKYGLDLEYTFCNGPFYLARWAEDNLLMIIQNDKYKGNSKVKAGSVYFYVNDDEDSVISKFRQHSYDCIFLSDSGRKELADSKKTSYLKTENTVSGLCFNCGDSQLENVLIRKALMMITRVNEIDAPENSEGKVTGIVPNCCRFGEQSYREAAGDASVLAYNEAMANEMIIKGMQELGTDTIDVKIICTDEFTAQMQHVIQNWQRLLGTSIIAKVTTLSDDDFRTAVKNGNYQIAVGSISAESSSAVDTLKIFKSDSKKNIFNYSSEAFDTLVDKIILTDSGSKIIEDCRAAEEMLVSEAVFCPLFSYADYMAISEDTEGIFTLPVFESVIFLNGGRS